MQSKSIELEKTQQKIHPKRQSHKRDFNYSKSNKKSKFPEDLQESSLGAIKQFLANHQNCEVSNATDTKIESSSQVGALFDKLLQSIIIVHTKGIQETTFFLDGDAFNSSVFHGAKITITEYSTAPKIFNVELTADAKAIAFIQSHAAEMLIALQKENLGFSVNRIDTSLQTEDERHAIKKVEREEEV